MHKWRSWGHSIKLRNGVKLTDDDDDGLFRTKKSVQKIKPATLTYLYIFLFFFGGQYQKTAVNYIDGLPQIISFCRLLLLLLWFIAVLRKSWSVCWGPPKKSLEGNNLTKKSLLITFHIVVHVLHQLLTEKDAYRIWVTFECSLGWGNSRK